MAAATAGTGGAATTCARTCAATAVTAAQVLVDPVSVVPLLGERDRSRMRPSSCQIQAVDSSTVDTGFGGTLGEVPVLAGASASFQPPSASMTGRRNARGASTSTSPTYSPFSSDPAPGQEALAERALGDHQRAERRLGLERVGDGARDVRFEDHVGVDEDDHVAGASAVPSLRCALRSRVQVANWSAYRRARSTVASVDSLSTTTTSTARVGLGAQRAQAGLRGCGPSCASAPRS